MSLELVLLEVLVCDAGRVSKPSQRGWVTSVALVVQGNPLSLTVSSKLPQSASSMRGAGPSFGLFHLSTNNTRVSSKISLPPYIAVYNLKQCISTKLICFHTLKTG